MKRFSDIEQFRHVIKHVKWYYDEILHLKLLPTMDFTGTVKLHGSNAGIRKFKDQIHYQSRETTISSTGDNYGFAAAMSNIPEEDMNWLFNSISTNKDDEVVIYGEWIGKGVQGKVAISKLEPKQFVIFAIKINDEYISNDKSYQMHCHNIYNILELPTYHITVNFNKPDLAAKDIEKYVNEIEECCPWANLFDVKGLGEGIVWKSDERPFDSDLWFKTKGTKHKVSREKKVVVIDPEVQRSIEDFVLYSVTDARLNQGLDHLREKQIELDYKNIGLFLKWICRDINKEEYDVLDASGLEWSQVAKPCSNHARKWIIDKIEEI